MIQEHVKDICPNKVNFIGNSALYCRKKFDGNP